MPLTAYVGASASIKVIFNLYSKYFTQEFTMKCIEAMQQYTILYVYMYLYGIL